MKVVVLKYHYNYAESWHRTSDGWCTGDYLREGVLIFTTQDKLSLKQNEVISKFIRESYYEENDHRSDGPRSSVFNCKYSKALSERLAAELLFDIINDDDVVDTLFSHSLNEHRIKYFNIDGVTKTFIEENSGVYRIK